MAGSKQLRPPFIWNGKQPIEDTRYARWSQDQIKAMKNGTYDWSKHEEKQVLG